MVTTAFAIILPDFLSVTVINEIALQIGKAE
jgi:hypothetical protein